MADAWVCSSSPVKQLDHDSCNIFIYMTMDGYYAMGASPQAVSAEAGTLLAVPKQHEYSLLR